MKAKQIWIRENLFICEYYPLMQGILSSEHPVSNPGDSAYMLLEWSLEAWGKLFSSVQSISHVCFFATP